MSTPTATLSSQTQLECQRIQQDEFEILSYIYLDEFHIIKEHLPFKFSILIRPYLPKFQLEYQVSLHFQYTKTYPKTALKYDIEPITGLTRDNLNSITKIVEDLIYENRGKPIVYDLVEDIRVWIVEYLVEGKAYHEEDPDVVKKIDEVFERPKFSAFTPVTVESFTAWKKEFDFKHKKVVKKDTEDKLSGKQWFLGKKDEEIQDSEEQDSEDLEDIDEEEEDNEPKNYNEPENKLFMMDEEEDTAEVQDN